MSRSVSQASGAFLLSILAAAAAVPAAAVQGPSATVTIETQVVGPYDRSGPYAQYALSRRGAHAGAVLAKGSRVAVSVDGVEGPRFDDILAVPGGRGERVAFSPDGSRYAYVGRAGQELVVIIDGKEALRVPAAGTEFPQLPRLEPNPGFTEGGKHAYFVLQSTVTNPSTQVFWSMYLDGVAGPKSGEALWPWFGPDGSHVAYIITNPANRQQKLLVFDGKPAGYPPPEMQLEGDPVFTGDGMHMFTKAVLARGAGVQVLLDGRPFLKALGAHVFTAPAGNAFVTQVFAPGPGGTQIQFLDIGGRRVPGTDGGQIDSVFFSPDGKHWAARMRTPTNSASIIADGKKGLDYQNVGDPEFTADGRPVYMAYTQGKNFMVVGEEESDAFQSIAPLYSKAGRTISWAIGGNRVGFIGVAGGNMAAVVDFKAMPLREAADIDFSPDASRYAVAHGQGLTVDGKDIAAGAPVPFFPVPRSRDTEPKRRFLFSPDSKHIAHFGMPAGSNDFGIFLDGKFLAVGGNRQPHNPTFTPDSKHLFWLDTTPGEPKFTLYLDGVAVLKINFDNLAVVRPGWWDMGDDGTLTIVAADEGDLKRIRITPGTGSSVETMLAKMAKPK